MGQLFAVRWAHDLHFQPYPGTIFTPEAVLAPERRSWLSRLDPESGAVRWSAKIAGPRGWLALGGERLFHLGNDLRCFDLATGELVWRRAVNGERSWYAGHLAVAAGCVLAGGWRGYTQPMGFDARTGEPLWVHPGLCAWSPPVAGPWGFAMIDLGSPSALRHAADQSLLGGLALFDPLSGAVTSLPLPGPVWCHDDDAAVFALGGRLAAQTLDGETFALAAGGWEPAPRTPGWRFAEGAEHRYGLRQGMVIAYDRASGELCWSAPVADNRGLGAIAELPDGRVVVGTSFGQLIVFAPDGRRLGAQRVGKRIDTKLFRTAGGLVLAGVGGAIRAFEPLS